MRIGNPIASFIVFGQPASKANSRRLVMNHGKPKFIKSRAALDYVEAFRVQCPKLEDIIEGHVSVDIKVFYGSGRPDLDESVILDCMQGMIYVNDRQVKHKEVTWALDRRLPRAEIKVYQWVVES